MFLVIKDAMGCHAISLRLPHTQEMARLEEKSFFPFTGFTSLQFCNGVWFPSHVIPQRKEEKNIWT